MTQEQFEQVKKAADHIQAAVDHLKAAADLEPDRFVKSWRHELISWSGELSRFLHGHSGLLNHLPPMEWGIEK